MKFFIIILNIRETENTKIILVIEGVDKMVDPNGKNVNVTFWLPK